MLMGLNSGAVAGELDAGGINRIFGSFAVPITDGLDGSFIGAGTAKSLLFVKLIRRTLNDYCLGQQQQLVISLIQAKYIS